jgi:hypothetical protein
MKFRKVIGTLAIATVFALAPAVVPYPQMTAPPTRLAFIGCGTIVSLPADAAFAGIPAPCPVVGGGPSPWWAFGPMLGAASVILNAAVVSNHQCRELTLNEALTSFALPFIGMLFNENSSQCGGHKHKRH